ncbi:hypothetical protein SRABI04_02322 [Chryseobacterium sp. Bi04]|nr:hypothetical protein SRABI04_02322 [Chryseobacterium sp. Bi04]
MRIEYNLIKYDIKAFENNLNKFVGLLHYLFIFYSKKINAFKTKDR